MSQRRKKSEVTVIEVRRALPAGPKKPRALGPGPNRPRALGAGAPTRAALTTGVPRHTAELMRRARPAEPVIAFSLFCEALIEGAARREADVLSRGDVKRWLARRWPLPPAAILALDEWVTAMLDELVYEWE